MVVLEAVLRAAHRAVLLAPGAAPIVALPDRALDARRDQITGVEKGGEELPSDGEGRLVLMVPADCRDLIVQLKITP